MEGGRGQPSCWPLGPAGSSLVEGGLASTLVRRVCLSFFFDLVAPEGARGTREGTADVPRPQQESTAVALLARGQARKQIQRYDGLFLVSYWFLQYSGTGS